MPGPLTGTDPKVSELVVNATYDKGRLTEMKSEFLDSESQKKVTYDFKLGDGGKYSVKKTVLDDAEHNVSHTEPDDKLYTKKEMMEVIKGEVLLNQLKDTTYKVSGTDMLNNKVDAIFTGEQGKAKFKADIDNSTALQSAIKDFNKGADAVAISIGSNETNKGRTFS